MVKEVLLLWMRCHFKRREKSSLDVASLFALMKIPPIVGMTETIDLTNLLPRSSDTFRAQIRLNQ